MVKDVVLKGSLFQEKILDVGAGGEEIILHATSGKKVTALVKQKSEIDDSHYKRSTRVTWINGDARLLEFADETFETVTMFCTLMYIRGFEEKIKALKECYRVLKKGGKFYLWDFNIEQTAGLFIGNLQVIFLEEGELKTPGYGIQGPNIKQNLQDILHFVEEDLKIEKINIDEDFYSIIFNK